MAGVGLIALIDDIATLLDDVSILTKVAAKKTAGVLGDDLALNAEQVSGVKADRELPVVWAVAKGSALNKLILVPAALLISAVAPWLITPLLMIGGGFLCFEGFEKIAHVIGGGHKKDDAEHEKSIEAISSPDVDLVDFEKNKIKGAIRTDFILSAEIVVITLGTVQTATFTQQVIVVSLLAALITVGVYGIVAGIVKLDDLGLYLLKSTSEGLWGQLKRRLGRSILSFCPYLMRSLSVLGTVAMFLVGGSILIHGVPFVYNWLHHLAEWLLLELTLSSGFMTLITTLLDGVAGIIAGAVIFVVLSMASRVRTILK